MVVQHQNYPQQCHQWPIGLSCSYLGFSVVQVPSVLQKEGFLVLVSVFPIFCFSAGDDVLWLALPEPQSYLETWLSAVRSFVREDTEFYEGWGRGDEAFITDHCTAFTCTLHSYSSFLNSPPSHQRHLRPPALNLCQKPGRTESSFLLCTAAVLMPQTISY